MTPARVMEQPCEVEWKNRPDGHIAYAILHCHVTDRYDVSVYGEPGEGAVGFSPEFDTLEAARDWAEGGARALLDAHKERTKAAKEGE